MKEKAEETDKKEKTRRSLFKRKGQGTQRDSRMTTRTRDAASEPPAGVRSGGAGHQDRRAGSERGSHTVAAS